MQLDIKTGPHFNLKSTIFSHGWVDLPPFHILENETGFDYVLTINKQLAIPIRVSGTGNDAVRVRSQSAAADAHAEQIRAAVAHMLRLDENLDQFYELAAREQRWQWIIDKGAGRMMRCPTLWEDMVKMLCTTNCTWRLTQIMSENLVQNLGSGKDGQRGFPTPEAVAEKDESFLRETVKMGYRAPYLLELANQIVNDRLDLSALAIFNGPEQELFKRLKQIKGFGDYAAGTMLKLMGHYQRMGFDSSNRKRFTEKFGKGKDISDEKITRFYSQTGRWAGLFFWMDVTEHWYEEKVNW